MVYLKHILVAKAKSMTKNSIHDIHLDNRLSAAKRNAVAEGSQFTR